MARRIEVCTLVVHCRFERTPHRRTSASAPATLRRRRQRHCEQRTPQRITSDHVGHLIGVSRNCLTQTHVIFIVSSGSDLCIRTHACGLQGHVYAGCVFSLVYEHSYIWLLSQLEWNCARFVLFSRMLCVVAVPHWLMQHTILQCSKRKRKRNRGMRSNKNRCYCVATVFARFCCCWCCWCWCWPAVASSVSSMQHHVWQ